MNRFPRQNRIPPGTTLKVYCPSKGVYHYGIASYNNTVIDRAPRFGVAQRSMWEFSEGQPIEIVERKNTDYSLAQTHMRAKRYLGDRHYDIFNANCEQFVNLCRRGVYTSGQVESAKENVLAGGLFLLGLGLFMSLFDDKD